MLSSQEIFHNTFEKVVEIVRKLAIKPPGNAQLSKPKTSGLSLSMFVAVSEQESVALIKDKPICKKFSMSGSCNYGDKCKLSHVTTNLQTTISPKAITNQNRCGFCRASGHSENECRKKTAAATKGNPAITLPVDGKDEASATAEDALQTPDLFGVLMAIRVDFNNTDRDRYGLKLRKQPALALPLRSNKPCITSQKIGSNSTQAGGTLVEPANTAIPTVEVKNIEKVAISPFLPPFSDLHSDKECLDAPNGGSGSALVSVDANKPTDAHYSPRLAKYTSSSTPIPWILYSGATISATHDPADCVNVGPCYVSVTAAGCSFVVEQRGTAVIKAADKNGAL